MNIFEYSNIKVDKGGKFEFSKTGHSLATLPLTYASAPALQVYVTMSEFLIGVNRFHLACNAVILVWEIHAYV